MLKSNKIAIRKNRFFDDTYSEDIEYSYIQYKKFFKSIIINEEFFTNHVKSKGTEAYKILKNIYKDLKNNKNILDMEFQSDELIPQANITRLLNIINMNTGDNLTRKSLNKIIKFKYNKNSNIQLYFKNENKVLNLYLIDVYHLAIPAKKDGKYRYIEKFNSHMKDKICISEIINEI